MEVISGYVRCLADFSAACSFGGFLYFYQLAGVKGQPHSAVGGWPWGIALFFRIGIRKPEPGGRLTATSKGDWLTNAANEYALGANASYKLSDALSVSGGIAYDAFDATKDFGGTASVAYSAAPLTASVATDLFYVQTSSSFDVDALLTVGYTVMEGLDA